MTVRLGYRWNLRTVMAAHGLFATTQLAPLLAERGIRLSDTQVYRLVTGTPQRLSLEVLMALCDIFDVTPSDLIEPVREARPARKRAAGDTGTAAPKTLRSVRARITPPEPQ